MLYNIQSKIQNRSYCYEQEVLKHEKDNYIIKVVFSAATRLGCLSIDLIEK